MAGRDDVVRKVTSFVISPGPPHYLLVFEHPLAGLQLPAGTVEVGEEVLDAARREVFEETGVGIDDAGRILGTEKIELAEWERFLCKTGVDLVFISA